MLNHQTVEKLHALRLTGMADAYRKQMEDVEIAGLSFEERFGLLVDAEYLSRENRRMRLRLRDAKLKLGQACIEDIDYLPVVNSPAHGDREANFGQAQARLRAIADRWAADLSPHKPDPAAVPNLAA